MLNRVDANRVYSNIVDVMECQSLHLELKIIECSDVVDGNRVENY